MRVAVLGSLSMELVTAVERLPQPGETVLGQHFSQRPGGKGLNQAVAAARLGAEVQLFGRVGNDPFGDKVLSLAKENGVDIAFVDRVAGQTGTAAIFISPNGEQMVAYTPGANAMVDEAYLSRVLPVLSAADVLLLPLEIPISTVGMVLSRLPAQKPLVILNPSFVQDLSPIPLGRVDVLVPSSQEFQLLSGWSGDPEDLERSGRVFLGRGLKALVVFAGPEGAYLLEAEGFARFPAFSEMMGASAVDAFCAALAVKLGSGRGLYEAIGFANAAAALTTAKKDSAPRFPSLNEVQAFLARFAD